MSLHKSTGASARFTAVHTATSRTSRTAPYQGTISNMFGAATFSRTVQEQHLPRETFQRLQEVIKRNKRMDDELAQAVSHAMKEWALKMGATHFCHWFQPQTGLTAEKHDSFLTIHQ